MAGWLARLPVRVRLTAWYLGLLAVILATLGSFLLLRLRADLVAETDQVLDTQAVAILADADAGARLETTPATGVAGLPAGDIAVQLLSPTGTVLDRGGVATPERPLLTPAMVRRVLAGHQVRAEMRPGPLRIRYRVLGLRRAGRGSPTVLVVAAPLSDVDRSVDRLRLLLGVAGPIALVLAGAGGWLLARAALRPVDQMTRQAGAIGAHRLHDRVSVPDAADELTRLARTLNGMLERIEHGLVEQRRFVADASHELRTPLAVMRAELEVALRADDLPADAAEVLASTAEEATRMSRIVDDLLTLAHRDEHRLELSLTPVDLASVATAVTTQLRPLADQGGVHLTVRAAHVPSVLADRARLTQAVTNLVDNAVKYTGADGRVEVRVWRADGGAGLTVTDSGPGIAAEDLPRVFDRFSRLDPARSRTCGGSGLGLAISKALVEAHGGRIWANSTPGTGSSFVLTLPAEPSAGPPAARIAPEPPR
jgi:two-component system, OmpR family, sensor kinase